MTYYTFPSPSLPISRTRVIFFFQNTYEESSFMAPDVPLQQFIFLQVDQERTKRQIQVGSPPPSIDRGRRGYLSESQLEEEKVEARTSIKEGF